MKILQEILLKAVVGHAGSAGGGALILDGLQNHSPEQLASGVGVLIATAGLSAFRKWRRNRKAKKSE